MESFSTGNWLPLLRASNKEVYRVKAGASAGQRQRRTLHSTSSVPNLGSALSGLPGASSTPAATGGQNAGLRRPLSRAADDTANPGVSYEPGTRLTYGSIVALQSVSVSDSWLTLSADIGVRAGQTTGLTSQVILDGAPSWCEVTSHGPWATSTLETPPGASGVPAPSAADAPIDIEIGGVTRKRRVPRIMQTCAFRLVNADNPHDRSPVTAKDTIALEVILNGRATGWCLGSRVSYHKPSDPR
jgi:hypothetical protein